MTRRLSCKVEVVTSETPTSTFRASLLPSEKEVAAHHAIQRQLETTANNFAPMVCSTCRNPKEPTATLVPHGSHLIVAFDRVAHGSKSTAKLENSPLPRSVFKGSRANKASLVAMARHHGENLASGHFTIDGLRDDQWWRMDDHEVASVAAPDFHDAVLGVYEVQYQQG